MADLLVRDLEDETLAHLQARAARHGVSVEEVARLILKHSVATPDRLSDVAVGLFGTENGFELNLPKHKSHEPIDFSS